MGSSREHMEYGQQRLDDCRERVRRQRNVVGALQRNENRLQAEFLLATSEKALRLMEQHQQALVKRYRQAGL
jgi:hypothetical protein